MQNEATESQSNLNARFRPALLSYFLRRVRNHAEAENLTQEVFLRLTRNAAAIPGYPASSYVFQTATNLLRDRARRHSVRSEHLDTVHDLYHDHVDMLDPARHAEARAELVALESHIRSMPERMRQAFLLYRFEGIGKAMIAESLNVSVSTVEKDIAGALLILAQALGRMR